MPKRVELRALTDKEAAEVQRLATSRTAPVRSVQRARIIVAMVADPTLTTSEAGLQAGYKSRQVGPQLDKVLQ